MRLRIKSPAAITGLPDALKTSIALLISSVWLVEGPARFSKSNTRAVMRSSVAAQRIDRTTSFSNSG